MNKTRFIAGLLALAFLAGCGLTDPGGGGSLANLPPCTGDDSLFEGVDLEDLPGMYHGLVATTIDAHVGALGSVSKSPLMCTAGTYRELSTPSPALIELAGKLPPWKDTVALANLSETDLGPVLLEFVRVYECALQERAAFRTPFDESGEGIVTTDDEGRRIQIINRSDLSREELEKNTSVEKELAVSRPALERTLQIVGGFDRLRPLAAELECLKRTSLDLRNVLGLAAEAVSCMPKIWDARGSLRDLYDSE